MTRVTLIFIAAMLGGCASAPLNPSFPITCSDARTALAEMQEDPQPFERPVLVASGIYDPAIAINRIATDLRRVTTEDSIIIQSPFFSTGTFDSVRDRIIQKVEESVPSDDPEWTVEVDVIGVSMGGLGARYAAAPRDDGGKRLRIRRLFTLGTPHRGADLAVLPTFDKRAIDMRADSQFLEHLNQALPEAEYELICYVRIGDFIVGEDNAAPEGMTPYWVPNAPFQLAHIHNYKDVRFLADIARRLRDEEALAQTPPAPLPD